MAMNQYLKAIKFVVKPLTKIIHIISFI